ncbi:MAG: 30S ribosomal protein S13 [Candidatus Marsarchaeota archaeon]|jgi:Ribosomal protein S13|nr:30S ribosomal protein S13 [Candidatus Marsarchaeota archaeon]
MAEEKQAQTREQKAADDLGIIRMAGRDIRGSYSIVGALMQIKGIGYNMARALGLAAERQYHIPMTTKIGSLTEAQTAQIEALMKDPAKAGVPVYMLNRQKDVDTGADMHVVGTDLSISVKNDIDRDIKFQTWRGMRHMWGQRVRGQRTRSTGRTGVTVGVTKAKVEAAAKAATTAGGAKTHGAAAAAAPVAGSAPAAGAAAAPPKAAEKKEGAK